MLVARTVKRRVSGRRLRLVVRRSTMTSCVSQWTATTVGMPTGPRHGGETAWSPWCCETGLALRRLGVLGLSDGQEG